MAFYEVDPTAEAQQLRQRDYDYLREVVRAQSSNLIDPSRNALFDTRLTPIARMAGAANLHDLVTLLRDTPADKARPAHLHRAVAEAMTINETSFFRDIKPFDLLRRHILPKLIEARQETRRLRIWSAACSTGQEAYSLAMLLREHFPELLRWQVEIVGSDLSTPVVEYARRGRYRRLEVNRGMPARLLVKHFIRDQEEWEVAPALRAICRFETCNLCAVADTAARIVAPFDLVLLRNVLLYFRPIDRTIVFRGVRQSMAADGYLLLGNSEVAEDSTNLFSLEFGQDCYFYRPS